MCHPALDHYCVDNIWTDLGRLAECLVYLPDVVIEHLHPCTGKSPLDQTYLDAGGFSVEHPDYAAYLAWQADGMIDDAAAVRYLVAGRP